MAQYDTDLRASTDDQRREWCLGAAAETNEPTKLSTG
jgi:hypothetical protein